MKKQTESLFNTKEKRADGTAGYVIDFDVQIRVVNDKKDLTDTESLIEIKDGTHEDFQVYDDPNTKVVAKALNGKEISVNADFAGDIIEGGVRAKVMPHEIGHTGGLKHPLMDVKEYLLGFYKVKGPTYNSPNKNFMHQGGITRPTGPTKDQMERIYRLYSSGNLNKRDGTHPVNQE